MAVERLIAEAVAEVAADDDWEKVNVRHDAFRLGLIVESSA